MTTIGPCEDSFITCYLNEIPAFVGPELARLYETLHSSLPYFELFRSLEGASCYVYWREGRPDHIFLFTQRGRCLDVLNEMIEVPEEEIARFAHHVFERLEHIDVTRFRALRTELRNMDLPCQRYGAKHTYGIALPETPDAYLASLGQSTRTNIRHNTNRIKKSFPTFRMEYRTDEEIDDTWLEAIMSLSETNIAGRGVRLRYDRKRIAAMAKACGFASAVLIDGRIAAGSINYRVGSNYFGEVHANDRQYERFGIGMFCTYQTIRESIVRGAKGFYLGGGHFVYKQRLGATLIGMDELNIYRSHWKMLANPRHAAGIVLEARVRAAKDFMHRNRDHALAKLVFSSFHRLKSKSLK